MNEVASSSPALSGASAELETSAGASPQTSSSAAVKHVVFFSVAASGHVRPTMPIVSALISQGHRVSYFASEQHKDLINQAISRGLENAKVECKGPQQSKYVPYPCEGNFMVSTHNPDKHAPLALQPAAVALMPWLLQRLKPMHIGLPNFYP